MIAIITIMAFMLLGAFLNRHRGGLIPLRHGQIARANYSIGLSIMLWWSTGDIMASALCPVAFFLGSLAPNGDWMNVRDRDEVFSGCVSGWINVAPALFVMIGFGSARWLPLFLIGLLKGPLYLLAQKTPDLDIKQFHRGPEMGEVLFGAALGIGVYCA